MGNEESASLDFSTVCLFFFSLFKTKVCLLFCLLFVHDRLLFVRALSATCTISHYTTCGLVSACSCEFTLCQCERPPIAAAAAGGRCQKAKPSPQTGICPSSDPWYLSVLLICWLKLHPVVFGWICRVLPPWKEPPFVIDPHFILIII